MSQGNERDKSARPLGSQKQQFKCKVRSLTPYYPPTHSWCNPNWAIVFYIWGRAACRTTSEELKQLGVRVEEGIDITSDASVASLRDRLGDTAIDVLINNAGIIKRVTLEDLDFQSIRE